MSMPTIKVPRYPPPLSGSATIGVTAPSSGIGKFTRRYHEAKSNLTAQGYSIVEGRCLLDNNAYVSASAKERARDFESLWQRNEVSLILPPWGGEQLIGIFEHLDWELLHKSAPKWCMGYSDISLLLFVLTTRLGIATAHGTCLMEMVSSQSDTLTREAFAPLRLADGEHVTQHSAERFQKEFQDYVSCPQLPFNCTEPVVWRTLSGRAEAARGRVIGGCIDVLMHLLGTRFDHFHQFRSEASADGVILYLENCELNANTLMRALHQLKYAGWFEQLNALVFGRNAGAEDAALPYEEVLRSLFADCPFPIIFGADIGHRQPNLTIINGSVSEFYCDGRGKGYLKSTRC